MLTPRIFTNKHPEPLRLANAVAMAHAMLAAHPKCSEVQIDNACDAALKACKHSYYGVGAINFGQIKDVLLEEHFEEDK